MLVKAPLFVLLIAALFRYPEYPSFALDPSWKMAFGHFFRDGLQFGPEVICTFGPLGFLYANTYIGLPFWGSLLWQLGAAVVCALVIMDSARRLMGIRRIMYFAFFLFLGSFHTGALHQLSTDLWHQMFTDVLHQTIIAMIGFELIHRSGEGWRPTTAWLMLVLALLANIKFTSLMLASCVVLIVCVQELWHSRWHRALRLATCFLAGFLAVWIACGQSLANLPLYLHNSWHISQGYHQAMGVPTPGPPFWLGLTVLALLSAYGFQYLIVHVGTSRTLSRFVLLMVFIGLIWKHGFVRSDGHMFIFFANALLPVVAFPALLDDLLHRRWPAQVLLGLASLLCVWGLHSTGMQVGWPDVLWQVPSRLQDKLWRHYTLLGQWTPLRATYERRLDEEKQRFDMPQTRQLIGQAAIDVLGYEQAIALYNGFAYRPRPVFQSFSANTRYLARLNDDFYRSSRAPDYALLKLQTIDNRFPTLDDSLLLRSFMHRYDYVHTERGFQLWKRRAQFRRVGSELPGFLRHEAITLNQPLPLGELTHKRLWATLHIQPSWWGHLRNIVYKTPMVHLALEDTQGRRSTFRLTLPQVATGFILNPLLEDSVGYVCFAMGAANRQVRAMTLVVPEEDRKFFHDMARLELSELPSASDGTTCRELSMHMYFWMFPSAPTDYEAPFTPQEVQIDARLAVMLHAPSKLEFAELEGATSVSGAFGFVDTAYTGSGRTDGATFRILWQDSHRQVGLYERRLDPLNVPGDRGLQDFRIDLKGLSGGKLVLQIDPDATGNWDWTAWTGVKIE